MKKKQSDHINSIVKRNDTMSSAFGAELFKFISLCETIYYFCKSHTEFDDCLAKGEFPIEAVVFVQDGYLTHTLQTKAGKEVSYKTPHWYLYVIGEIPEAEDDVRPIALLLHHGTYDDLLQNYRTRTELRVDIPETPLATYIVPFLSAEMIAPSVGQDICRDGNYSWWMATYCGNCEKVIQRHIAIDGSYRYPVYIYSIKNHTLLSMEMSIDTKNGTRDCACVPIMETPAAAELRENPVDLEPGEIPIPAMDGSQPKAPKSSRSQPKTRVNLETDESKTKIQESGDDDFIIVSSSND